VESFAAGGAPTYARLAEEHAADPIIAELGEGVKPRWQVPLRLFGAVHYLVLSGEEPDAWERFGEVLRERKDWIRRFVVEQPVQTNEVQRCWALLPAFLWAVGGQAVDLIELGPSGGLNLYWDTYRYRYEGRAWGPTDAELELDGVVLAPPPAELFERTVDVRTRLGIDQSPVDVSDEQQALLLQAFVWADHRERLERLRGAIERARRRPPELVQGDYVRLLPEILEQRDPSRTALVFNSATLSYLRDEEREELAATIESAGSRGSIAWISYEFARGEDVTGDSFEEAFTLEARTWPGGEPLVLSRSDGHGNRLRWLA